MEKENAMSSAPVAPVFEGSVVPVAPLIDPVAPLIDPVAPLIKGLPIMSASPTTYPNDEIKESLASFFTKLEKEEERKKLADTMWSHRSSLRNFYAKNEVSQEIKIFGALTNYGLPVNRWFLDACEENVPFAGCGEVSWFKKMGDDGKMIDLSDELISFKKDEDAGKPESTWSAWPTTEDDDDEDDDVVVGKIDLFRFILANPETIFHTNNYEKSDKELFLLHVNSGKLAYDIFMALSSEMTAEEKAECVWSDVIPDLLYQKVVVEEPKDPRAIAEFCVWFPRVFLKMLFVVGLTNTRKIFKIMGTRYVPKKNSTLEGFVYQTGICRDELARGKEKGKRVHFVSLKFGICINMHYLFYFGIGTGTRGKKANAKAGDKKANAKAALGNSEEGRPQRKGSRKARQKSEQKPITELKRKATSSPKSESKKKMAKKEVGSVHKNGQADTEEKSLAEM